MGKDLNRYSSCGSWIILNANNLPDQDNVSLVIFSKSLGRFFKKGIKLVRCREATDFVSFIPTYDMESLAQT